ncbi:LLM class flavin-dependent oxidoreductase [Brevibacillus agri]|uniref:LLM class flavin-dependent oxidoreductase n=1 Tax=Brevibacillus agri TaxID=51101 RepID=UPI00046FAA23|nr:LLM class flavin-dependent oxidoreductase [Brevibacillus agri]WHX28329.1 LLM class flavin-dependent oxidoreductase [Brevibacillus agri]
MKFYADLPMWLHHDEKNQLQIIHEAAHLLEANGFTGSLLFYQHTTLDPWIVAAGTLQATNDHLPIIALQPNTVPPFTAAKMIHSLVHLYGRKVALNMIPGQSISELRQVNDTVPGEERFDRLVEYIDILRALLRSNDPLTYKGKYFTYNDLQIFAQVDQALQPLIFMPGASTLFQKAAHQAVDVAIQLASPVSQLVKSFDILYDSHVELCCRLGMIARPTSEEALEIAKEEVPMRFMQIVKKQGRLAGYYTEEEERLYFPVEQGKAFRGPLLVGSYDEVASYFRGYKELGIKHVIFSCIRSAEDLHHVKQVLDRAGVSDTAQPVR